MRMLENAMGPASLAAALLAWCCAASAAEQPVPTAIPAPGDEPLGAGGLRLPGNAFTGDRAWDDGLAEVGEYELSQARYGALHAGRAVLVVVREDLDPQAAVKAVAPAPGSVPVLKCHLVKSFQTGIYRYEQAATVFLRREDAVPLRLLIGGHEWCGVMGKGWVNRGAGSRLRSISYFDGHGDQEQELALGGDGVLADALTTWLRAWLATARRPGTAALVPTQLDARSQPTAAAACTIRVGAEERAQVPAGGFTVVPISVAIGDMVLLRAQLESAPPYRLIAARYADGSTMRLLCSARFAYWTMNDPGQGWPR